jgi:hypothetical protein
VLFLAVGLGAACSAAGTSQTSSGTGGSSGGGQGAGPSSSSSTGTGGDGFGDGGLHFDGGGCTPLTCADLGADCGQQADGCGNTLDCGTCTAPAYCGGGGPSKCGADPCTPLTCDQLGASCGMQGDGCGKLIDCGSCTAPQTCGGSGVPNVCGGMMCTPKSCADQGYNCGPVADGCGGLVDCGMCTVAGEFCGGGGKPNVCGSNIPVCNKLTCADWGANCGPVSDGCGGLTANCGTCSGGNCCGCGGTPNVCGGAPPPCVPKTCADLGANCGQASDGCGGLTANCGTCSGGNCCGCGGTPNVCGGAPTCTPATCANFPAGTCGQQSDGCGGLTANCGTCPTGQYCGGGGPNKCGTGSTCINLQCKQVTCTGTATTSISGTVYDPAGLRPLPNVYVYVPNGTPAALTTGASCDQCSAALSGLPLVTTITDAQGHFKLGNMPVGPNIPVVIQVGKWRRQITVTTSQCADTAVMPDLSRLPRNKSEGDIPKIALTTGGSDSLECLLRKIGISDSEFTGPTGTGRVNLFKGQPQGLTGKNAKYNAANQYDSALGGGNFPDAMTLWGDFASLQKYDVTLLSCEGDLYSNTKPATALKAMYDYVNGGGRVFASHFHHYWVSANTNGTGSGKWSTLASWIYNNPISFSPMIYPTSPTTGTYTIPETVVKTFPKGALLADWLVNVGASTTNGTLPVFDTRHSVQSFDQSRVLEWVYAANVKQCQGLTTNGACVSPVDVAHAPQYITFNAPVGAAASSQCGRFVFSDIHVATGDRGQSFPSECMSTTMTPQELALEFMFFDLASAVCDEMQPPPMCTPLTCADQGIQCGPAPNGCGGTIASCGTCPAGMVCGTGGKCAGSSCTPTTCAALGKNCGSWSDGCGNTLNCGTCTSPNTCGGGGTPGVCGAGSCVPTTCAQLGYNCGQWSNGCGGILNCGTCTSPETCGGGGMTGQCGGTGCTPKTCAELGVSCGMSGDGCGGTIDCGPCNNPTCTPLACGGRCGPQGDGCGGVIQCPACPPGTCIPTTCLQAGAQCGFFPDGCGNGLDCGMCSPGQSCVNNKCVTAN